MSLCVPHAHRSPQRPEEGIRVSGTRLTDSYKPHRCWETNLSPSARYIRTLNC